jgi:hypothetical protein
MMLIKTLEPEKLDVNFDNYLKQEQKNDESFTI